MPPPEIPRDRLDIRFSRSGGPGGQNVNKVETQVEVRVNLTEADWLSERVKERLRTLKPAQVTRNDELIVVSSRHREQRRNLEDCIEKLQGWIAEASHVPRKRRPTRPTKASKKRRLDEKRKRSSIKAARKKPARED